eukprot:TRINITY_DN2158_c0_g1_i4.p1 TRINITY_DN2158_c0_g1~~TRINITY_DN2158_c0_g1_i4.p1  ORF type:complete len:751 (+),score=163.72 TRINITY_DN2158_c0_g1_i4:93-2255(+)
MMLSPEITVDASTFADDPFCALPPRQNATSRGSWCELKRRVSQQLGCEADQPDEFEDDLIAEKLTELLRAERAKNMTSAARVQAMQERHAAEVKRLREKVAALERAAEATDEDTANAFAALTSRASALQAQTTSQRSSASGVGAGALLRNYSAAERLAEGSQCSNPACEERRKEAARRITALTCRLAQSAGKVNLLRAASAVRQGEAPAEGSSSAEHSTKDAKEGEQGTEQAQRGAGTADEGDGAAEELCQRLQRAAPADVDRTSDSQQNTAPGAEGSTEHQSNGSAPGASTTRTAGGAVKHCDAASTGPDRFARRRRLANAVTQTEPPPAGAARPAWGGIAGYRRSLIEGVGGIYAADARTVGIQANIGSPDAELASIEADESAAREQLLSAFAFKLAFRFSRFAARGQQLVMTQAKCYSERPVRTQDQAVQTPLLLGMGRGAQRGPSETQALPPASPTTGQFMAAMRQQRSASTVPQLLHPPKKDQERSRTPSGPSPRQVLPVRQDNFEQPMDPSFTAPTPQSPLSPTPPCRKGSFMPRSPVTSSAFADTSSMLATSISASTFNTPPGEKHGASTSISTSTYNTPPGEKHGTTPPPESTALLQPGPMPEEPSTPDGPRPPTDGSGNQFRRQGLGKEGKEGKEGSPRKGSHRGRKDASPRNPRWRLASTVGTSPGDPPSLPPSRDGLPPLPQGVLSPTRANLVLMSSFAEHDPFDRSEA